MKIKQTSRLEMITRQLELIEQTNEIIEMFEKKKEDLMIRQYKHLKKKYVKNLFDMLAENYQFPSQKRQKQQLKLKKRQPSSNKSTAFLI